MKKAYFTALLVVLITGSLFGSARSYLRAGRDKIMMGRNRAINQLHIQPAEYEQEKPVYYRRKSYRNVKPLGNEQGTLCSLNAYHIGRVYTAPERLDNERSHSENASIVHSPPPTLKKFQNARITGHFGFVFSRAKLAQGNHVIIVKSPVFKNSVPKLHGFPSTLKRKAGVFKLL